MKREHRTGEHFTQSNEPSSPAPVNYVPLQAGESADPAVGGLTNPQLTGEQARYAAYLYREQRNKKIGNFVVKAVDAVTGRHFQLDEKRQAKQALSAKETAYKVQKQLDYQADLDSRLPAARPPFAAPQTEALATPVPPAEQVDSQAVRDVQAEMTELVHEAETVLLCETMEAVAAQTPLVINQAQEVLDNSLRTIQAAEAIVFEQSLTLSPYYVADRR